MTVLIFNGPQVIHLPPACDCKQAVAESIMRGGRFSQFIRGEFHPKSAEVQASGCLSGQSQAQADPAFQQRIVPLHPVFSAMQMLGGFWHHAALWQAMLGISVVRLAVGLMGFPSDSSLVGGCDKSQPSEGGAAAQAARPSANSQEKDA